MTSPRRILIAEPLDFSPQALAILQAAGEVTLRNVTPSEFAAAFQAYDVIWFRLATRITAELIGPTPLCRILATPVTGLDHIDLETCRSRGIRVVSLRGEVDFLRNVRATAELTIALTLALLRNIPQASMSVQHGEWNRDNFRGHELYGKTAGIVGVGRLGTLVAGYFKAFGMRVIGYDTREDYPTDVAERVDSLDELLANSDVVSLHVAYNDSTRHLIGKPQFAKMREGAILINTARGGVVDEVALLEALNNRRIMGAALDVLEGEPSIDGNHPLVEYSACHDNLLIVPHVGGNTVESFAKTELFLANRVVEQLAA